MYANLNVRPGDRNGRRKKKEKRKKKKNYKEIPVAQDRRQIYDGVEIQRSDYRE